MDYLTTHPSLSPIWRGFMPGFVNYKKGCTRLTAATDKVYQLLAHVWWFSPGILASSTTKTGRHVIAEIWLKVALNTINQIKSLGIKQQSINQCTNKTCKKLTSSKYYSLYNRMYISVAYYSSQLQLQYLFIYMYIYFFFHGTYLI